LEVSPLSLYDSESFRLDDTGRSPAYFSNKPVTKVTSQLIAELKEASIQLDGTNIRICLHENPDAEFHQMINLEPKGKYYRPHKHPTKGESYHIIEGSMAAFVLNEDGVVTTVNVLDAEDNFIYRIGPDTYHALAPLSDIVIYHESKLGPFVSEGDSIFPDWAPNGEDPQEVQAFIATLLANVPGR